MSVWQQLIHFVSAGHESPVPHKRRNRDKRNRTLRLEALETRQLFAIYAVDSVADVVDANDGVTTLREAVALAEANAGADTIKIDASLAGQAVELLSTGDTTVGPSALAITSEITIDASDAPFFRIGRDVSTNMRLFYVSETGNLTLDSITLQGGKLEGYEGAARSTQGGRGGGGGGGAALGGAIYSRGVVTIIASTLTENSVTGGSVSRTSGFVKGGGGGAGLSGPGSPATSETGGEGGLGGGGYGGDMSQDGLDGDFGAGGGGGGGAETNISGNGGAGGFGGGGGGGGSGSSGGAGGAGGFGAGNGGVATNVRSGAGGGGAGLGGAIFNDKGTLTIINSTLTSNTAAGGLAGTGAGNGSGYGGAVFSLGGNLTILNSTFDSNTAEGYGGAVAAISDGSADLNFVLSSSILSNSTTTVNDDAYVYDGLGGTANVSGNGNLIESSSTLDGILTETISADPELDNLADNGGPTWTMLPSAQSPVIGAGANLLTLPYDQRGLHRTVAGLTDIGAVQVTQSVPPVVNSITRSTPENEETGAASVTFTVTFNQDVTGLDASQVELTGTTAASCTVTSAAGTGSVYTVTVTNAGGQGTLGLNIKQGVIKNDNDEYFDGTITTSSTYTLVTPIIVDSLLDVVDANDGVTTLREAVAAADALPDLSYIWFKPSIAGGTILLSEIGNTDDGNSALEITTSIEIDGANAPGLVIGRDAAAASLRQFHVSSSGNLTLENITISGGQIVSSIGGEDSLGGAVYNRGRVMTIGSTFTDNVATGVNGGGSTGGAGLGGAIYNDDAVLVVINSTFTNNSATGGTNVGHGEGLGGAIYTRKGMLAIYNSTIAANSASTTGGAVYVNEGASGEHADVTVESSILADSTDGNVDFAAAEAGGAIGHFGGYNIVTSTNSLSLTPFIDYSNSPQLAPLANNGGPTQTMMLGANSNGLGNGVNSMGLITDQAGNPRATGGSVDIGALQWFDPPVITSIARSSPSSEQTNASSVTFTITFDESVTGLTNSQIELTGAAAGNATISQVSGTGSSYQVTVNTASATGTLGLRVKQGVVEDTDGNDFQGQIDADQTYTIDRTAPAAPVVSAPSQFTLTEAATYDVAGTAETNSLVKIYLGNNVVGSQQLTGGATHFSITVPLGVGSNGFLVSATRASGAESAMTQAPAIVRTHLLVVGTNAGNKNAPLVKVYDATSGELYSSFLAYEKSFTGGVRVTTADLDNNGSQEIIVTPASKRRTEVRVFSAMGDELTQFEFTASKATQKYGSTVAAGDVDGDGYTDIILGAGSGQTSHVRVFKNNFAQTPEHAFADTPNADFKAFPNRYKSGVSVASGDIDGDGKSEIIIGSNAGQIATVAVFNILDTNLFTFEQSLSFQPYGAKYKGGVSVAAGDADGDGHAEIVTAPGEKGGTLIQIHDGQTGNVIGAPFAAFPTSNKLPVNIVLKDLDGDGRFDEIFAAAAKDGTKQAIKRYRPSGQASLLGVDFVFETVADFRDGMTLG